MKNTILTSILVFFSFISSLSQCKTYGLYLNYGVGTNFKSGNSITIEVGYPRITAKFFPTGVINSFGTRTGEFYTSYGIQFNSKTHIGNNDLIQYVNVLNSRESYTHKNMVSGTIGLKWLQRMYKDSNAFLMGNLGYRQLKFDSFKWGGQNNALFSELGVVVIL